MPADIEDGLSSALTSAAAWLDNQIVAHPRYLKAFAGVGALYVLSRVLNISSYLFLPHVLPSRFAKFKHPEHKKGKRPWAIVTGASDGIGKGFVFELAAQGFNVVLCARNKAKLESVVGDLKDEFPATVTKLWVADAGNVSGENAVNFRELLDLISGLPVTVLINNVGIANDLVDFERLAEADLKQIINVNTVFPTLITKHLIPILEKNGPSLIINVGSIAGDLPMPYLSPYCGTKAYNKAWSKALSLELSSRKSKIQVQSLIVGDVSSNSNHSKESLMVASARQFARTTLRVPTTQKVATPYFFHKLGVGWTSSVPNFVMDPLMVHMTKQVKASLDKRS
ncbi:hypothetical protein DFJ77DRAFT_258301 [Powellomyces hirtus]|nr:hypothetical protein DFJ77DRAFT_258301 [Powellomyces hirtus]